MGIRFRKSIKLAPGLRLNVGKSGLSLNAGVRGASVSFGSKGTYLNTSIPGTGISSRQKIGGGSAKRRSSPKSSTPSETYVDAKVRLEDDGTVRFLDQLDNPLPPALERKAKEQQGPFLQSWLEEQCEKRNAVLVELETIHETTPAPDFVAPVPEPFTEEPPATPQLKDSSGFFNALISSRREAIERENQEAQQRYEEAKRQWEGRRQAHEQREQERVRELTVRLKGEVAVMEQVLLERLQGIEWPRETNIAFDLLQGGWTLALDVDLPEIEDFPAEEASVAARGYKLNLKKLSQTRQRELYARHVHGVALRLMGEAFAALPSLKRIVISGYTQRIDKATGHETDTYIYSAVVPRKDWVNLNFSNLQAVDPIHALDAFDLKRNMTATGIFKAIEPHDPQQIA